MAFLVEFHQVPGQVDQVPLGSTRSQPVSGERSDPAMCFDVGI